MITFLESQKSKSFFFLLRVGRSSKTAEIKWPKNFIIVTGGLSVSNLSLSSVIESFEGKKNQILLLHVHARSIFITISHLYLFPFLSSLSIPLNLSFHFSLLFYASSHGVSG